MDQVVALAISQEWVVYTCIGLSCASLILAFWCFMFMAREKKVGTELQNIGGSFEGLDGRLSEIQQAVSKKIDDTELRTHSLLSQTRDALKKEIGRTEGKADRALASTENVMQAAEVVKSVQESFQAFKEDVTTQLDKLEGVAEDVSEIRSQIVVIETDLKDSLKEQVNESFQQLDATILAVLETIQGEMLRSVDRLRDIQDSVVSRTSGETIEAAQEEEQSELPEFEDSGAPESPDNIISAEPLFACLASKNEPYVDDEPPAAEPEIAFTPQEITVSSDTISPETKITELTSYELDAESMDAEDDMEDVVDDVELCDDDESDEELL